MIFNFLKKNKQKKIIDSRLHGHGFDNNHYHNNFLHHHNNFKIYSDQELLYYYRTLSLIGKGVDLPINDVFQTGRTIVYHTDNEDLISELDDFYDFVDNSLLKLLRSARIYGNAVMVIVSTDDTLDQPLNYDNLQNKRIDNFLIYNNESISVHENLYNADKHDPDYGKPLFYKLTDFKDSIVVHSSRVIDMTGEHNVVSNFRNNIYSRNSILNGVSLLQKAIPIAKLHDHLLEIVGQLGDKALIDVIAIKDLYEKYCNSLNTETEEFNIFLKKIKKTMNSEHIMITDNDSNFTRNFVDSSSIITICNYLMEVEASIFDIVVSRFASRVKSTLNNTNGDDRENYGNTIRDIQKNKLRPAYNKIDKITSKMYNIDIEYHFNDILKKSDEEKLTTERQYMDNAVFAYNNNIMSLNEALNYLKDSGLDVGDMIDLIDGEVINDEPKEQPPEQQQEQEQEQEQQDDEKS